MGFDTLEINLVNGILPKCHMWYSEIWHAKLCQYGCQKKHTDLVNSFP